MMKKSKTRSMILYSVLTAGVLFIAPLAGVRSGNLPASAYLEFPPVTRYIAHAPFSWVFFTGIFVFVVAVCFPFVYRLLTYKTQQRQDREEYPFPWWGWLGLVTVLLLWILAWNRFSLFAPLQRYTFFPLWVSFILVVNGLTQRRKGSCQLTSNPVFFLSLFPVSALFWWYFEYLNRFVQNWYYLGGGDISATEYIIHASVCFSTVLPAVLSTNEYLQTFQRLAHPFKNWKPVVFPGQKSMGWLLLSGAAISMANLAVFPDYLFSFVWISPLLIITGVQLISGQDTIFAGAVQGNWKQIVTPALAALICGFFWELWNWKSLAHWEYSVPFVHRFHIFEMPLLGYAGYLPFGLECAAVAFLLKTAMIKE